MSGWYFLSYSVLLSLSLSLSLYVYISFSLTFHARILSSYSFVLYMRFPQR